MLGNLNLFRTLFGPEQFPRNLAAVDELKRVAATYGKTLPQFALRWTLRTRSSRRRSLGSVDRTR